MDNTRVSVTYFRTAHFNQTLTDNEALGAADYDPYCVTAPVNSALPGGGGNEICGFADISSAGQAKAPINVIKLDTNLGDQTEVYNSVDTEISARFANGAMVQGGVSVGRSVNNSCFVVDSPQDLYQCEVATPWWDGNGQIKFSGSYPLPFGIALSAVVQNLPGREIRANAIFLNSEIAPSLGRNLSSCPTATGPCNATVTLDVIEERNSLFEDRITQIDFRVMKDFNTGYGRLRITLDLYNALNASPIFGRNNNYGTNGAGWGNVTQILAGRLVKMGAQYSWN